MALLLAFDDTDGLAGGCTTYLAFHVLLALPGLALGGMPRLVRLNPNVPWKTRGNGAVVLPLVEPLGPSVRVGELRGREILAFPDGPDPAMAEDVLDRAWQVIERQAQPGSQPAVALAGDRLPSGPYWQAVRTLVDPAEGRAGLESLGAVHRSSEGGRALAGCLGALSWPGPASSYEFLTYRHPSRWGTPREVRPGQLLPLDASGATFHTADPVEGRLACVPHGPDPVLLGLRGRDADALRDAALRTLPFACGEPIDGWLLWATNHGSGDHVTPVESLADAPELATVQVAADVVAAPESRAGGHAFVGLADGSGVAFLAAAFEPTKGLRDAVRGLLPGDRVVAVGAWKDGVVNLEKLNVLGLAPDRRKAANPRCPQCRKAMKSAGAGQGFRCRACGTKAGGEAGEWSSRKRTVEPGWHEAPVLARRHLHRPVAWGEP